MLASGLGLPQLEALRLEEVLARVVNSHEHRTGSKVNLATAGLPEQADLSVKITVYRIVQEALNNASTMPVEWDSRSPPGGRQAGSRSKSRTGAPALTSTNPLIGKTIWVWPGCVSAWKAREARSLSRAGSVTGPA